MTDDISMRLRDVEAAATKLGVLVDENRARMGEFTPLIAEVTSFSVEMKAVKQDISDLRQEFKDRDDAASQDRKEAREDRRAVKIALLGFAGVIIAALIGLGGVIISVAG